MRRAELTYKNKAGAHVIVLRAALLALVLAVLISSHAYAQCSSFDYGLTGHWRLDESSGTFADSSPNSNTGTESGGVTYSQTGLIADGIGFSGTDEYISASDDASLDFAGGSMTAAAWIYPTSAFSGFGSRVVDKRGQGSGNGWQIKIQDTGGSQWRLFDADLSGSSGTLCRNTGANSWDYNSWYHIAGVYEDPDMLYLYVNGALEQSVGPTVIGDYDNNLDVAIGASIYNNAAPLVPPQQEFTGTIDEVRIYNRALSASEIAALYAQRSNDQGQAGQVIFDVRHAAMRYCDDTDWRMMGIGSYNPSGVYFDGTNDYLGSIPTTLPADGMTGTLSVWFKANDLAADRKMFAINSDRIAGFFDVSNSQFRIVGENSSNTNVLDLRTVNLGLDTSSWHHLLSSWNLEGTPVTHLYIDGESDRNENNATADELIDYDGFDIAVGAYTNGTDKWNGFLADFWFDSDTFIELDVTSNRRKFLSANGMPVFLGDDGSIPTGEKPDIFFSGDTITFTSNRGSLGAFTTNGALSFSSSQPADLAFDRGVWTQVGNDLNFPGMNNAPDITRLDETTIAFADAETNELETYSWDGSDWSQVGNSLSITAFVGPGITTLDTNLIAYIDSQNDRLKTYSWDGSDWSQVGNELHISGISWTDITALDSSTIAQFDSTNDEIRTYSWDGTDWSQVGSGLNPTLLNETLPALATLSANTIAIVDGGSTELATYYWDGSNWMGIGNSLAISGLGGPSMEALNSNTVVIQDQSLNRIRTYRWNGTDWRQIGTQISRTMSYGGVTALNNQTIAVAEANSDDLRTYSFSNCLIEGILHYDTDFNVMEYCNGAEWVAMGPVGGTPPTSGLVAHWMLDETSGFTAENAVNPGTLDGTISNGLDPANDSVDGVLGTALNFDNNDDMIEIASDPALALTTFSLSSWFNIPSPIANGWKVIYAHNRGGNNWVYLGKTNNANTIHFRWSNADTMNTVSTFAYGEWVHTAASYDVSTNMAKVYLNGVLDSSDNTGGTTPSAVNDVSRIGRNTNNTETFAGYIDDVRVYNRILTDTEVAQLYHFGYSGGLGDVDNGCTDPIRDEGVMLYNQDNNYLQYCNGEQWIIIGH